MDFNQLLARMQELDRPVAETVPAAENCGGPMSMPPSPSTPPVTPPSMSVNLNAQGMDNIEDLLKLITKVNPDMGKPELPPLPSLSMPPSITSIKPAMPPLKMLPDMDGDNDDMPGGEKDGDEGPDIKGLDRDKDGDHDMDDHDIEKDNDMEKKKDEWANSPDGAQEDPEIKDTDYMVNKLAGGMNGPKKMFKHSYKQGDNPMAMEGEELRAWIKSELKQKLEEAKSR